MNKNKTYEIDGGKLKELIDSLGGVTKDIQIARHCDKDDYKGDDNIPDNERVGECIWYPL